jgi:hypothetical protein
LSAKRREGGNFGNVFTANAVILAARVRIYILRAMAVQFTSKDETAYVNTNAS